MTYTGVYERCGVYVTGGEYVIYYRLLTVLQWYVDETDSH